LVAFDVAVQADELAQNSGTTVMAKKYDAKIESTTPAPSA